MPSPKVSVLNPANAVTACRLVALPPFAWAVAHDRDGVATLCIAIIGLFDKLDGLVARVFDCRSTFGEMFDAVADGVCYGFCLGILAWFGRAPLLPVAAYLGLGVANVALRLVYARRAGRVVNYKSYANERLIAMVASLIVAGATRYPHADAYAWGLLALGAVVFVWDARRMVLDPVPEAG